MLFKITPLLVLAILGIISALVIMIFFPSGNENSPAGNKGWEIIVGLIIIAVAGGFFCTDIVLKLVLKDYKTLMIIESVVAVISLIFLITRR